MAEIKRSTLDGIPLRTIAYCCRPPCEDEGVILAYVLPGMDWTGKQTVYLLLPSGDLETWYLFPDEMQEVA